MKKILAISLMVINLFATDDLDIDSLLNNIETKTDLSEKTKLENSGISHIYTREDLRRMQAHNLKDILKSTYPFGYNENNFGVSDPHTSGTSIPYSSSSIKIYIDDQELVTGLYGSGINIYGDMDIDFVDHIEVYSGNPTFEFSTEPAFVIIKLYSKVAQRDSGSKISARAGSHGAKALNAYNSGELKNGWSYFTYASYTDKKRKKYENRGAVLSRDTQTTHFFGSLYNDTHKILIDAISQKRDSFMAQSVFATPKDSTLDTNYLHIGYDGKYDNLTFLLSFDKYDMKSNFEDLYKDAIISIIPLGSMAIPYAVKTDSKSEVYTAGVNYTINSKSNKLLLGLKYRHKHFKFDTLNINGIELPRSKNPNQITSTAFLENQYLFTPNSIFTTGVSYAKVSNSHSIQENDLFAYRLGFTYTSDYWTFKTVASHLEASLDPYLVNSIYLSRPSEKIKKIQQQLYMQEIKYEKDSNKYKLMVGYIVAKDHLRQDMNTGLLDTYKKSIHVKNLLAKYTKKYNSHDKLDLTFGTSHMNNLPKIDTLKQYAATIRNFNSYEKFDIFNELIFYKNDLEKQNCYDYSAGIIYHKTDDLTFSIKGTNIFNKAKKSNYMVLDNQTFQPTAPLQISPIDQKFMISIEYTF